MNAADGHSAIPLAAFSAVGLEIEYALVDCVTLDCRPIADQLLTNVRGEVVGEQADGRLAWSNEFFLHVLELKNPAPTDDLTSLQADLQRAVHKMNRRLKAHGACLMPGAIHPWMEPTTEGCRWPFGETEIYDAYASIFNCQTHGWANLQSMHINLPFADDTEFARLHAAVRLVLPLIPALAASSPVANGKLTGFADFRLETYRTNASAYPSITGHVIPETVLSEAEYRQKILQPMYRAIAPVDPHGILQHDWLNSRGAIARFDRNAIEIRVTDTQECVAADLAVASAIIHVTQALYQRSLSKPAAAPACSTLALEAILLNCISDGESTVVDDARYLAALGWQRGSWCTAAELWRHLQSQPVLGTLAVNPGSAQIVEQILQHGTLSRRIVDSLGTAPTRERLRAVYLQLCACLEHDRMFIPTADARTVGSTAGTMDVQRRG